MSRRAWLAVASCLVSAAPLAAQASEFALRFHGTGAAQQDRARLAIDDDAPGPDASSPCDVGAGSFTLEFWLRGALADNSTANAGGDVETSDFNWILGNTVVDRDIFGGSGRDFGVSIAGGFVRFGTGPGDSGSNGENTIEGDRNVLDGAWHHVACVRDAASGRKSIYVDGALDFQSSLGVSTADLSYPDDGVPTQATPWGPYLVLGAEKHDAGASYPSFDGYFDELRVWSTARSAAEILATFERVIAANSAGLVGYFRFEEGAGVVLADTSAAQAPPAELIAALPGNGEWVSYAAHPSNTAPVVAGSLPAGFVRTTLASGFSEPTSLAIAPDGRLFVGQRDGRVRVYANGQLQVQPLVDVPCENGGGERGLVGLCLDPQFASNGYLYAFHTTPEPRDVVTRFTVVGSTASLASAQVIWAAADLASDFHHGGALAFGADGRLYIAVGDQRTPANAQTPANEYGKLLRLNPDGSVPADNPFVGVSGAAPSLFALGLRNPFRLAVDPLSGRMWLGDVGANSTNSFEELNPIAAGANFGWPNQEGPACFVSSCANHTFPTFSYAHDDPQFFWNQPQGSVTAGAVYRGATFPAGYQGNLFFGDYANRWIRRAVFDAAGALQSVHTFVASPEAGTVVDLEVGPDGALYYVTIGIAWTGAPDPAAVHRIQYSGSGNQAPVAQASAAPTAGSAPPLAVQFSSAGSGDPDSGPGALTFAWEFGDGAVSSAPNPQHTYASFGAFEARLTVGDGAASSVAAPIGVTVGARPQVQILTPPPGASYRAGETIVFSGAATDVEDGPLAAAALSWQVVLVHGAHVHPFAGPFNGVAQGQFTVPLTGHSPVNTHYEVLLSATDSHGLSSQAARALAPELASVTFTSTVQGVPLFIDGEATLTPTTVLSLVNHRHLVEAQPSYAFPGLTVDFLGWSDQRPIAHYFRVPAAGAQLTAFYAPRNQFNVSLAVPASNRNAEHWANGQQPANFFDPAGVCIGRDSQPLQAGFEFLAPIPEGATIVSARLDLRATADQFGPVSVQIRGYDVASAPAFVFASPTPLTQHAPLTSAFATWSPTLPFAGAVLSSPDLTAIVQEIVSRSDWQPGGALGLVLDGAPTSSDAWRCVRNFASGDPPVLVISYETNDYARR
jgi:glucose/arabinose dehydrogenase/PKD repeat protein